MIRSVVRVPATSANLGPGFDCLGLALDLHNTITLDVVQRPVEPTVHVTGEGFDRLPRTGRNLALRAAQRVLRAADSGLFVACVSLDNRIPVGSGLGSSAAAIAGAMVAANAVVADPFSSDRLLQLAMEFEPHPDNLAAAFYGGFTVAVDAGDHPSVVCFPPPAGLRAVVLTPSLTISTHQSRATLPINVSHKDASYNVGRACLLVASLLAGRFEMLRIAMEDRMHQPYRAGAYPAMVPIIEAAKATGVAGAALSGSGPSIIALCDGATEPVVHAMQRAADAAGLDARTRELDIVPAGAGVSAINS